MNALLSSSFLPSLLTQFLITAVLSFIIGLELHSYRRANGQDLGFGTTRTFTLIGITAFVLYAIDEHLLFYLTGLLILTVFLAIYYLHRSGKGLYSLLSPLLGVLTYLIPPVLIRFPDWFVALYVVAILLMLSEKPGIRRFSDTIDNTEIVTFTKFLIMAGVILPLLPARQIAVFVPVTYYQVWSALLVVSALSYISYLAQTYLFKEKGLLLTGILGGLYSSTATTVVLGRRARQLPPTPQITQAIILATTMMYFRLLLLVALLGYVNEALRLLTPLSLMVILSLVASWLASRIPAGRDTPASPAAVSHPLSHPLEFRTALFFALLFVLFSAITAWVISRYGEQGLQILAFIVGLTDIDPFILSILGGKYPVNEIQLISAIVIACGSNNLVKAGYALVFGRNRYVVAAAGWLTGLFVLSMAYVFLFN